MWFFSLIGRLFGSQRQSALSFLLPVGLMLLVIASFSSCGNANTGKARLAAPAASQAQAPAAEPSQNVAQAPPTHTAPEDKALIQAALDEANAIRRQNQLSELTLDSSITVAAQRHAVDMERRKYFEHVSPEGETPSSRMEKAGSSFQTAAENIAMGVVNAREVFQLWLNSSGHRENLLNKNYRRQGIGYFGGHWVHNFAD